MVVPMASGTAYLVRVADFDDAAGIGDVHVVGWRSAYRGILPDDYLDGMSDIRQANPKRGCVNTVSTSGSPGWRYGLGRKAG